MDMETLMGNEAITAMLHTIQCGRDCQEELLQIAPFKFALSQEDLQMVTEQGHSMLALATTKAVTAKDVHRTISNKKAANHDDDDDDPPESHMNPYVVFGRRAKIPYEFIYLILYIFKPNQQM